MKRNEVFIKHIRDEVNFIISRTEDLEYESLIKDEVLKRALLRSLEVIGEATKNISPDFREKFPDVEWRELAGLRDKLIHRYFGVKWEIVWDVIRRRIPKLKEQIESILEEVEEQD